MFSKSIAIVNDDQDLLSMYSEALQMSGYDVSSFADPVLAYEHIKENPNKYSLLITDYRMPHMNGLLLAMKLLEINQNLKVIILSSCYEFECISKFRFIRKPISILKFVKIVHETIFSSLLSNN